MPTEVSSQSLGMDPSPPASNGYCVPRKEMRMSDPKPCPFCGKPPIVGPEDPAREGNAWGFVQCVNERCPAQPRVRDGSDVADERGSAAYKRLAIRRWNRRAPSSTQQGEGE